MGKRGYNGTLTMRVPNKKYPILVQAANQYSLHTLEELEESIEALLDEAKETEDWVQWYDRIFDETLEENV